MTFRWADKKIFPLMNIRTSIRDSKIDMDDTINGIVRKAKRIEHRLGHMTLMSDGKLEKVSKIYSNCYLSYLVTREGCFNISRGDTDRFYWGNGKNFFDSEPYFIDGHGEVYIGSQLIDQLTFKLKGHTSFAQAYNQPLFTIEGLYKQKEVNTTIGFFRERENIEGKIRFLEQFLDKTDKSGYMPRDMIVKNDRLRLKLLEKHYRDNLDFYSS